MNVSAQQLSIDPIEARDRVLSGFAQNYEIYQTTRGVLHYQKTWSEAVKARFLESAGKQGPGIKLSPLEEQLAPREIRFSIKGSQIRFDGSMSSAEHVIITDRGKFTYYSAANKSSSVREYNVPFHQCRDPREIFFDDSLRWEDVLLKARLNSATINNSRIPERQMMVLTFTTAEGAEYQVECDEDKNWLPVRYLERSGTPDSLQVVSGEMTYQQLDLQGRKAWFPADLVHKFWGSGRQPRDLSEDLSTNWASKESYVVKEIDVNVPISDEEFIIDPVEGTLLTNSIEKTRSIIGQDLGQMTDRKPSTVKSWWLVLLNLSIIVALLIALIARRKSHAKVG